MDAILYLIVVGVIKTTNISIDWSAEAKQGTRLKGYETCHFIPDEIDTVGPTCISIHSIYQK